MDVKVFLFLLIATTLETLGDAVVRMGIGQTAWAVRGALFAAGALLLFGYGLFLNLAPVEFNRVVGVYIATLLVWQVINLIVFRMMPDLPILLGGALIVAGGFIVTLWRQFPPLGL
jgi:small multidrug resistance family-3 protein